MTSRSVVFTFSLPFLLLYYFKSLALSPFAMPQGQAKGAYKDAKHSL